MKVYAGLDLHATNTYVAMIDAENKVLYKHRHRNDVPSILSALDPFREDIQGVVVESTFNWYWLVDALMDHGYRVHLANVSAIKQYEGLKQIDDRRSSLWLAHLLRLNILPTGYIYPKEERPTRDLLRKRLQLVRHWTSHVLSVKNILARNLGIRMKTDDIKKLRASEVNTLFADTEMRLAIMSSLSLIQHFQEEIDRIETVITKKFKVKEEFKKLLTVPGIGEILGLTIMLEVGHIDRFPTGGMIPLIVVASGASIPRTGKSPAMATAETAINISPGHTWKRPILPEGITKGYRGTMKESVQRRTRSLPSKQ